MDLSKLSAWERLYVAMQIGVRDPILVDTLSAEVRGLLDAESLLTLAVLLAVSTVGTAWGGPAAWVAELGLAAAGLWYLGREAVAVAQNFGRFVQLALAAKAEQALQEAGHEFALGLGRLGSTLLAGLLTSAAFKAARAAVAPRVKGWVESNRAGTQSAPPPAAKAQGPTTPPPSQSAPPPATKAQGPTTPPPRPADKSLVERAKTVGTTAAEVGLSRPIRDASLGQVFLPLAVLGAAGVGALVLAGRAKGRAARAVTTP